MARLPGPGPFGEEKEFIKLMMYSMPRLSRLFLSSALVVGIAGTIASVNVMNSMLETPNMVKTNELITDIYAKLSLMGTAFVIVDGGLNMFLHYLRIRDSFNPDKKVEKTNFIDSPRFQSIMLEAANIVLIASTSITNAWVL